MNHTQRILDGFKKYEQHKCCPFCNGNHVHPEGITVLTGNHDDGDGPLTDLQIQAYGKITFGQSAVDAPTRSRGLSYFLTFLCEEMGHVWHEHFHFHKGCVYTGVVLDDVFTKANLESDS